MFSENKRAKLEKIVGDVYMWGIQHPFVQTNVMVISEHILYNDRCVAALLLLKEYENNVLLALPQPPSQLLCRVSSSVWLWSSLIIGGSPGYLNQNAIPQLGTSLCLACKKKPMKAFHKKRGKKGKRLKKRATTQSDDTSSPSRS